MRKAIVVALAFALAVFTAIASAEAPKRVVGNPRVASTPLPEVLSRMGPETMFCGVFEFPPTSFRPPDSVQEPTGVECAARAFSQKHSFALQWMTNGMDSTFYSAWVYVEPAGQLIFFSIDSMGEATKSTCSQTKVTFSNEFGIVCKGGYDKQESLNPPPN